MVKCRLRNPVDPADFCFLIKIFSFHCAGEKTPNVSSEAADKGDSKPCLCDGYLSQTGVYLHSAACFFAASVPKMICHPKNVKSILDR